ncbi:immunoglobulin-like domain-containing protein [Flavobacterium sp.]
MKKLVLTLLFASSLLVSCEEDTTANVSRVTNYPLIEVLGDELMFVPQGTTFNDPGAVATAGGVDIPFVVTAEGTYRGETTLNTNVPDEYIVRYTATNEDGFQISGIRKVIVYKTGDLVNDISGVYVATTRRNGSLLPASQGSSVNMKYIFVWKNTDGTYGVSDAFGGWYAIGRKLGLNYATQGGIINAVNIPANQFTFPGAPGNLTNPGFGGAAELTGLTVNPATKTLVLSSHWLAPPSTNYNFEVTLVQEQL